MSVSLLNHNNLTSTSNSNTQSFNKGQMEMSQKDGGVMNNGLTINKLNKHCCEMCRKPFASKYNLTRHFSEYHLKEKKVNCGLCGKEFAKKCNLTRHLREFHQKTKKYICPKCGTELCSSYNLKRHKERVHDKLTNNNNNTSNSNGAGNVNGCEESNNIRSQSQLTTSNNTISQLITLNKCPYEGWEFQTREQLEIHIMQIHSNNFNLSINPLNNNSNSSTSTSTSNTNNVGTGNAVKVKQHICKTCSKAFAEKNQLTKHSKIHIKHLLQQQTQQQQPQSQPQQPQHQNSSGFHNLTTGSNSMPTSSNFNNIDFQKEIHQSSHNSHHDMLPQHLNIPMHLNQPIYNQGHHNHHHQQQQQQHHQHQQLHQNQGNSSRFSSNSSAHSITTGLGQLQNNSAYVQAVDKIFNFVAPSIIPESFNGKNFANASQQLIKRFDLMKRHRIHK